MCLNKPIIKQNLKRYSGKSTFTKDYREDNKYLRIFSDKQIAKLVQSFEISVRKKRCDLYLKRTFCPTIQGLRFFEKSQILHTLKYS